MVKKKTHKKHTCDCEACMENQGTILSALKRMVMGVKKYKCPNPDCKYVSDKKESCCGVKLVEMSDEEKKKKGNCCGPSFDDLF